MKCNSRSGFTLMEMLIVVAIISILVAIAIPVFSGTLEKSREATDLANVRGAYAQLLTDAMLSDKPEELEYEVALKQKKDDFQSVKDPNVGGITKSNTAQWIGFPKAGGNCRLYYTNEEGIILNWSGSFQPFKKMEIVVQDAWNGNVNTNTPLPYSDLLRSTDLKELKANTKYKIKFKIPSDLSYLDDTQKNKLKGYTLQVGTLVFDDEQGTAKVPTGTGNGNRNTGWKNLKNGFVEIEFETTEKDKFLGVNFHALNERNTKIEFTKDENKWLGPVFQEMMKNAVIEEVS